MSRLSWSLPLVAYRGLWDKFAAPATLDAFRRAYVRGVSCVLRGGEVAPSLRDACALVADSSVNRRAQLLYLAGDPIGRSGLRSLSCWYHARWVPVGLYMSVHVATRPLESADFSALSRIPSPILLVESWNVLDRALERSLARGLGDDDVLRRIRALCGSEVRLARVSDFVELDQLERQTPEAA